MWNEPNEAGSDECACCKTSSKHSRWCAFYAALAAGLLGATSTGMGKRIRGKKKEQHIAWSNLDDAKQAECQKIADEAAEQTQRYRNKTAVPPKNPRGV